VFLYPFLRLWVILRWHACGLFCVRFWSRASLSVCSRAAAYVSCCWGGVPDLVFFFLHAVGGVLKKKFFFHPVGGVLNGKTRNKKLRKAKQMLQGSFIRAARWGAFGVSGGFPLSNCMLKKKTISGTTPYPNGASASALRAGRNGKLLHL
jgi:hypothetical protein